MVSSNSSRLARRRARVGGNRPRTHPPHCPSPASGGSDSLASPANIAGSDRASAISAAHREAIEAERRNLQLANAVLGCLVVALEYGYDVEDTDSPDYADAVLAARNLVRTSITMLDSVRLARAGAADGDADE